MAVDAISVFIDDDTAINGESSFGLAPVADSVGVWAGSGATRIPAWSLNEI
eukprot:CAMPEP_0116891832 /NCGR_PEP_ID=MMETSP0467-20121206/2170_1 /TAXON_ID=283647 /ORGANISM="Mesodinium pulex, Strain SPMC105" /LENGTH=50 /DNA_ID=CAMNT_0004560585 /DNA_START=506 /DNA_END=658 /DNA_ORIENTATION=-